MMFRLFKKSPKNIFPEQKHVIEHAFTIAGKEYFKFTDHLNIPYERALSCLVYYREVDLNIDRDFLSQHLEAINEILTSNQIDVFKIKTLNDQLRQRLELPKDPELMYKLASVVFLTRRNRRQCMTGSMQKERSLFGKSTLPCRIFFCRSLSWN
jgi:hypothetical protein